MADSIASDAGRRRPQRVLHICDSLSTGGAEKWLLSLLRHYATTEGSLQRVDVEICLTSGHRSDLDAEAEKWGATLHYVPYSISRLWRFRRAFSQLLRERSFIAIHDHQGFAAGLHFMMAGSQRPPVRIAHFHNPVSDLADAPGTLRRRLRAAIGSYGIRTRATQVLGTSEECLREHGICGVGYAHLKPRALNCGINTQDYRGNFPERQSLLLQEFGWERPVEIVMFVGRLGSDVEGSSDAVESRKNPLFALEVMREVIARRPSVRFLMAGSGDMVRTKCERLVADWGLASHIRLLGVRNDVPRLMGGSNLLLFPSSAEGLGMVAVEAQAAGMRVLASDSVPAECVIARELVTFLPLACGTGAWASSVAYLLGLVRPDNQRFNDLVRTSSFSIDRSAEALIHCYRLTPSPDPMASSK